MKNRRRPCGDDFVEERSFESRRPAPSANGKTAKGINGGNRSLEFARLGCLKRAQGSIAGG